MVAPPGNPAPTLATPPLEPGAGPPGRGTSSSRGLGFTKTPSEGGEPPGARWGAWRTPGCRVGRVENPRVPGGARGEPPVPGGVRGEPRSAGWGAWRTPGCRVGRVENPGVPGGVPAPAGLPSEPGALIREEMGSPGTASVCGLRLATAQTRRSGVLHVVW